VLGTELVVSCVRRVVQDSTYDSRTLECWCIRETHAISGQYRTPITSHYFFAFHMRTHYADILSLFRRELQPCCVLPSLRAVCSEA